MDVIGYEGIYKVSDTGIVYSVGTNWRGYGMRPMGVHLDRYGYLKVVLTANKIRKKLSVHKIVAMAYLGERGELQVRHLDGNKVNNSLSNLKYGTAKENAEDRHLHGNTAIGQKIGTSKLTDAQVEEIRRANIKFVDMSILAAKYNVSCACISMIINNKSRKL